MTERNWRLVLQDLVWTAEYDLRSLGQCGPTKQQAVDDGRKLLADFGTVPPDPDSLPDPYDTIKA